MSKLIKEVVLSWLKVLIVLWLAISLVFYILSGNGASFLWVGILLLASGLPHLFIGYNRKKRHWMERTRDQTLTLDTETSQEHQQGQAKDKK